MLIKFGLPVLAALALGFGLATTLILKPEDHLTVAPHPPATSTLGCDAVAGLGELQPPGEPILVGTAVAGLVHEVQALTGAVVKKGDPLFTIDDRALRAQFALQEQILSVAQAKLDRLRAGTRPEDLPPARARVDAARVALEREEDLLTRAESLGVQNVISREELKTRGFALRQARAELAQAQAELARLEAGTWGPDLTVAQREADQARAALEQVRTELDRLVVRAPADGRVLRIDVRPGEFVQSGDASRPPVVLARNGPFEVRVQVDEEDASRIAAGAPAEGFVRGRERVRIALKFVRIEPRVVPKTSLAGVSAERVDTRVLFVVYEATGAPEAVYAGQKLDVFIPARPRSANG